MTRSFEKTLVEQCAPTLAGIKPGSLFRFVGREKARRAAAHWDRKLRALGLRVKVLKECCQQDAAVIYVYRRDWLERILRDEDSRAFLREIGYSSVTLEGALEHLSHRLCLEREYPHEIGVFLGYPLEDVIGFIENRGRNFTCCGQWKCYGDPAAAQACFARYRACTDTYTQMYGQGVPIVRLVVAA